MKSATCFQMWYKKWVCIYVWMHTYMAKCKQLLTLFFIVLVFCLLSIFTMFLNKKLGENYTDITSEFGMGLEFNDETAILSNVDSYYLKPCREHTVCLDS